MITNKKHKVPCFGHIFVSFLNRKTFNYDSSEGRFHHLINCDSSQLDTYHSFLSPQRLRSYSCSSYFDFLLRLCDRSGIYVDTSFLLSRVLFKCEFIDLNKKDERYMIYINKSVYSDIYGLFSQHL